MADLEAVCNCYIMPQTSAEGGFAAARFAGEQANAAQFEQVAEANFSLGLGIGGEQRSGRQGLIEREMGQRKVLELHQRFPPCGVSLSSGSSAVIDRPAGGGSHA